VCLFACVFAFSILVFSLSNIRIYIYLVLSAKIFGDFKQHEQTVYLMFSLWQCWLAVNVRTRPQVGRIEFVSFAQLEDERRKDWDFCDGFTTRFQGVPDLRARPLGCSSPRKRRDVNTDGGPSSRAKWSCRIAFITK